MEFVKCKVVFFCCLLVSFISAQNKNGFNIHFGNDLGITFQNTVTETDSQNIMIPGMPYLYAGGGVAIEDFNNDGLPDVFLLGNQVSSKLYINKGSLQFVDKTEEFGIRTKNWCSAVLLCDVNNDGYKDLYILKAQNNTHETGGNMLYVNYEGKYFKEESKQYNLNFNGRFLAGSFFDYDNDGDQDLYLATYPDNSKIGNDINFDFNNTFEKKYGNDLLLENKNNKRFKEVTNKMGILPENGFGISVTTTDFNNDNLLDIYVGNDFSESDFLYINTGNGFKEVLDSYFKHTSYFSMGTDVNDLNNDGLPDIIQLDMNPVSLEKYKRDFSSFDYYIYLATKHNYSVQEIRNSLQFQNNDGTFSDFGQLDKVAYTDWSWSPLIADFDLDGHKDIFISNGLKRDILNQNIYTFQLDSALKAQGLGYDDVTNTDLLNVIPKAPEVNYFFKNNGNKRFRNVTANWANNRLKTVSTGAALADLDNDGDMDIVCNNIDSFPMVYENLSSKNRHYIGFTTSNYKFLNTKITVNTNQASITNELRTNKGFISASQPLALVPLGDSLEGVTSFSLIFPNGNKYVYKGNMLADTVIDIAYLDSEKLDKHEPLLKTYNENVKALLSLPKPSINGKNQSLALKFKANYTPVFKKLQLGNNLQGVFVGAASKQPAQFVSVETNNNTTIHALNNTGYTDLDIVNLGNQRYAVLSQKKDSTVISILSADNPVRLFPIFVTSAQLGNRLAVIKANSSTYLLVLSSSGIKHSVFQLHDSGLVFQPQLTRQLNSVLHLFNVTDAESFSIKNEVYLAGVFEKPSVLKWQNDTFVLEHLTNQSGYFDRVYLDIEHEILLFSNLSENFRFNLLLEDSLVAYAHDFDNDNVTEILVCASINAHDFPIYTYNDFVQQLSGVRKLIPEIKHYYKKTIQQIYRDVDYTKLNKKSISSVRNVCFDVSLNKFTSISVPQFVNLNSATIWNGLYVFGAGTNTMNPVFGELDAANLILYTNQNQYKIRNTIGSENMVYSVEVFNETNPVFIICAAQNVYKLTFE